MYDRDSHYFTSHHFISFHFSSVGRTVLITGATGLIGTELTKSLRSKNITVRRLTTGSKKDENDFSWNPSSNSIGMISICYDSCR